MYCSWNRRTAVSLGSSLGMAGLALLVTASCAPGSNDDFHVADTSHELHGTNGIGLNGIGLNGIGLNGIGLNGIGLNGIGLNGIGLNGIGLNGIGLNGIGLNGIGLNGIGLNGIGLNGITINEVPMSAEQEADIRVLLSYMAGCALPEAQQITVTGGDSAPLVLQGLFGLAPEWATGPLSPRGERLVSACLAARSNTQGKHVRISLRGAGLETTAVERATYSHHEGAFWGNLFSDSPAMYTCSVEGADISGRSCTDGDCGFQSNGTCASVCRGIIAEDGHYTNCAGDELVLSTFLAVTDKMDFGALHGCTLRDGIPWCWGDNDRGQLGDATHDSRAEAAPVSSLNADVVEISGGAEHTCARGADGSAWCWGDNARGQLGLASKKNKQSKPEQVLALGLDVASIGAGAEHSCALTTDGSLWCWGDNRSGQLGGAKKKLVRAPALVESLGNDVARLALGESADHTCAVSNNGALWCWGENSDGQIGDGSQANRKKPVQVETTASGESLGEVTDACTGALHTCAQTTDGSVWCWGSNEFGQLGNATQKDERRPVRVAIDGAVAQGSLSCGANHTCAIANDGSLQCWGDNAYSQLGNGAGTLDAGSSPKTVTGLNALPIRVSADADRTCALLEDESWWCWGQDPAGWFFAGAESSAVPVRQALIATSN
jgi:alpha-tubulin suppressor-like RCC1 family protein